MELKARLDNFIASQPPRTTLDDQMDVLYEQAYIEACELDSPNSPGFDNLHESVFERLCSTLPD